MRLLTSIGIILALLICLGLWTNYSLQVSTRALTRDIDQISQDIEARHWEKAQAHTEELEKAWRQEARWWPIFLDHQEMDNINFSMARVKAYVASRDNPSARGQLAELRLMIRHIPDKEAVNLKNIL